MPPLEHRTAIRAHGLTPFHRRSFQALRALLAGEQQRLDLFGSDGGDPDAAGSAAPDPALGLEVSGAIAEAELVEPIVLDAQALLLP